MKTTTRAISILAVVSSFAFQSSTTAAQPAAPPVPKEIARELAKRGFDRFNADAYDEAISLYRQAYRTFQAPTILMLIADAHDKKGDVLSARAVYQEVANATIGPTAPQEFLDAQRRARTAIAILDKRIPHLRITVLGGQRPVQVTVNGVTLPATSLGAVEERNPGEYTIVATELGGRTISERVTLHEGTRTDQSLTFPKQPSAAAPPSPVTSPPQQTERSTFAPVASKHPPPIHAEDADGIPMSATVAFIAAALGTGTGLIMGGFWIRNNNDIRTQCEGDYCPKRLEGDIAITKKLGVASLVSFGVAGAGLGLGLILLTTNSKEEVGLSVYPSSITLRGAF